MQLTASYDQRRVVLRIGPGLHAALRCAARSHSSVSSVTRASRIVAPSGRTHEPVAAGGRLDRAAQALALESAARHRGDAAAAGRRGPEIDEPGDVGSKREEMAGLIMLQASSPDDGVLKS